MRAVAHCYVPINENNARQIEVDFKLNWLDRLMGKPEQRVFIALANGRWVDKKTRKGLSLLDSMLVAGALDHYLSEDLRESK